MTFRMDSVMTGPTLCKIASFSAPVALRPWMLSLWRQLSSGVSYISLMLCERLLEVEWGHADVVTKQTFDCILRDLVGGCEIIVDLRFDSGGWERVLIALASHSTDSTLQVLTKQLVRQSDSLHTQTIEITLAGGARYNGPMAVLTSDATIGAVEVGTLRLHALPNTRSFERSICGALFNPLYFRLPNGWRSAVSSEIYQAVDGQIYKMGEVPPDHPSAETSASAFWEISKFSFEMPRHGC